jgi:hypothetical protein
MVPGMAFPRMGRNGIPPEFQWNSIRILFVYLLLIVYLLVQMMFIWQPNTATLFFPPTTNHARHHRRPSRPPTMGRTLFSHHHQWPPPTSVVHAHDYHSKTAPRHQMNERRPHRHDKRRGVPGATSLRVMWKRTTNDNDVVVCHSCLYY